MNLFGKIGLGIVSITAVLFLSYRMGYQEGVLTVDKSIFYSSPDIVFTNDIDDNVYISTTTEKRVFLDGPYDIYCSLPYYEPMQPALGDELINKGVNTNFQYLETKINEIMIRLQKLEAKK